MEDGQTDVGQAVAGEDGLYLRSMVVMDRHCVLDYFEAVVEGGDEAKDVIDTGQLVWCFIRCGVGSGGDLERVSLTKVVCGV